MEGENNLSRLDGFYGNENLENIGDYSTIYNNSTAKITFKTTELNNINKLIGENDIVYPENEEIPLLEIKDENSFSNGAKIEDYLKKMNSIKKEEYNDKNFNMCKNCKNTNTNAFFCENCNKNICEKCSIQCKKDKHNLINLLEKEKDVEEIKLNINRIMSKRIMIEKKEKSEKSQKNYSLSKSTIDINKSEIREDINDFENLPDFKLIARIISKKYINYFHFRNIYNYYIYLVERYVVSHEKRCLRIIYDIESWKANQNQIQIKNKSQNQIQIKNQNENKNEIRIFGSEFVNYNQDKFPLLDLIINNEKTKLTDIIINEDDYLEVIIVQKDENSYLKDMSGMFCECDYIKEFKEFPERELLDFSKVEDISYMFRGCSKIKKLNLDIFKGLVNIVNMESLFFECKELIEINGLQEWYTPKVTSMTNMFNGCEKLKKINDIAQFRTDNVSEFSGMFYNCKSLSELPDIRNWEMKNAKKLESMFEKCESLVKLPDISNWNMEKVKNMKKMFCGCKSLENIPDFRKWNLASIRYLEDIFKGCEALNPRPDLSQWKIGSRDKLDIKF